MALDISENGFENTKKQDYFSRFKAIYGVAGIFWLLILIFVFWTNLKSFIDDLNMYSTTTSGEISALMSTIIPFETLTVFIVMTLSGIALFYLLKLSKKAFLFLFIYLGSYPVLLSVVEFEYTGDMGSVFGILAGGIIIFMIFWHLYKKHVKAFFKKA